MLMIECGATERGKMARYNVNGLKITGSMVGTKDSKLKGRSGFGFERRGGSENGTARAGGGVWRFEFQRHSGCKRASGGGDGRSSGLLVGLKQTRSARSTCSSTCTSAVVAYHSGDRRREVQRTAL